MANPSGLTRTEATPYSLALTLNGNGGTVGHISYAFLHSVSVPGPLDTLLTQLYAKSAMDTLNLDQSRSPRARFRSIEGINAPQTPFTTRTIVWTAQGLDVTAVAASESQIELRLEHSFKR